MSLGVLGAGALAGIGTGVANSILNPQGQITNSQGTSNSEGWGSSWESGQSTSNLDAWSTSNLVSKSEANAIARTYGSEASAKDILRAAEANALNDQYLRMQMAYNSAEAEADRRFQEYMSNTSYQRVVKDLISAGINPMLAVQNAGASTPSGAQASSGLQIAQKAQTFADSYSKSKSTSSTKSTSKSKTTSRSQSTNSGGSASKNYSNSQNTSNSKPQNQGAIKAVTDIAKKGMNKVAQIQAPKTTNYKPGQSK